MSLTSVRSYFRGRLDSLGYKEWTDGFEFDDVPETVLDQTYHITTGTISTNSVSHTINDLAYPVTIRLYLKGFRDPAQAIDDSITEGERIINDVTSVANSNGQGIKEVRFSSMEPTPKDVANDNIVLLVMTFDARVILDRR